MIFSPNGEPTLPKPSTLRQQTVVRYYGLPPHLAVALPILALLADPVDGVEVIVRAHARDRLLQEVQQVGGAAGHPTPVRHDVVRSWGEQRHVECCTVTKYS